MSGSGAQYVLNVPNAQKHPKFNSDVDEKYIHRGMLYDKKVSISSKQLVVRR